MRHMWALGLLVAGTPAFGETAVDVDVAEFLGCALYDTGDVYCFGQIPGDTFSLPLVAQRIADLPPAQSVAVGRFGACAVDVQSQLWCWGLDYQRSMRAEQVIFTSTPFVVEGLPKVRAVDLGYGHVCAISRDADAWCWGENACGEIGCGHTDPVGEPTKVPYSEGVRAISTGVANTCAVFA
ncbi:MAG: hypothetical protein KJN93_04780, partial [Alphaproteobacteria bacterium]|nr:hypothetical protein [Alphaproteobacteria bacterium]